MNFPGIKGPPRDNFSNLNYRNKTVLYNLYIKCIYYIYYMAYSLGYDIWYSNSPWENIH